MEGRQDQRNEDVNANHDHNGEDSIQNTPPSHPLFSFLSLALLYARTQPCPQKQLHLVRNNCSCKNSKSTIIFFFFNHHQTLTMIMPSVNRSATTLKHMSERPTYLGWLCMYVCKPQTWLGKTGSMLLVSVVYHVQLTCNSPHLVVYFMFCICVCLRMLMVMVRWVGRSGCRYLVTWLDVPRHSYF